VSGRVVGWVVLGALAAGLAAGILLTLWRATGPEAPAAESGGEPVPGQPVVRVEVLNGAGRAGLARVATAALRDAGYDVVFFGNAPAFDTDSSVVIDRVDRPELAEAVGAAAGIGRIRSEPDPGRQVEATVLLGRDWEPPPGAQSPLFRVD
jgi:hypothetical protein